MSKKSGLSSVSCHSGSLSALQTYDCSAPISTGASSSSSRLRWMWYCWHSAKSRMVVTVAGDRSAGGWVMAARRSMTERMVGRSLRSCEAASGKMVSTLPRRNCPSLRSWQTGSILIVKLLIAMSIVSNRDPEANPRTRLLYDLLADAGYATVRLLSLRPFDKIVGGLAWGITVSNNDIEVDYSDEMRLGEKIRAGQRICQALRIMECPFALSPFQVQGLDIDSIYQVVRWLAQQITTWRADNAKITARYCTRMRRALFNQTPRTVPVVQAPVGKVIHNTLAESIPVGSPLRIYSALVEQGDLVAAQTYGKFKRLLMKGVGGDEQAVAIGRYLFQQQTDQSAESADLSELKMEKKPAVLDQAKIGQFVQSVEEEIQRLNQVDDSSQATQIHELSRRRVRLDVLRQKEKELKQSLQQSSDKIAKERAQVASKQARRDELAGRLEEYRQALAQMQAEGRQKQLKRSAQQKKLGEQKVELKRKRAALKRQLNEQVVKLEQQLQEAEENQSRVDESKLQTLEEQFREKKKIYDKKTKEYSAVCRQVAVLQRRSQAYPGIVEIEQYRLRFLELFESINRQIEKRRTAYALTAEYESLAATLSNFNDLFLSFKNNFANCQKSKSGKQEMVRDVTESVAVAEANAKRAEEVLARQKELAANGSSALRTALNQQKEARRLGREVSALVQRLNSENVQIMGP